ncbi:Tropomyosin [Echinococcus granulosus]|nr:Tropomyosin [Echinococcus granulosus]
MKSLEVSEQESLQREESYEETIRDLTERLKTAEQRAAEAERQVSKLQNEVDRLEDELLSEKERYRAISGELDTTFAELTSF